MNKKLQFYQFRLFSAKNIDIFRELKKTWEENTKNSSKKLKVREDFPTPEEPSDGIKKPVVVCIMSINIVANFCIKDLTVELRTPDKKTKQLNTKL